MSHSSQLLDVCRRLAVKGLVAASDGNLSIRLPGGNILATPSGMNKGMVHEEDLVELTIAGEKVAGHRKMSTEIGMHLFIYQQRADVHAIVHAHPPYATGFAVARVPLDSFVLPEVIVAMGSIPLADYATPSTSEIAQSIAPFVQTRDAILLSNHGAVTYGPDIHSAYFKMEKLEQTALITFVATLLGGPKQLSPSDLEKLRSVSVASYGKDISAFMKP